MRAGTLDRKIVLVREEEIGRNPYNEPIYGTTETPLRASVQQQSGKEYLAAGQVGAPRQVVFRVRWIANVSVTNTVQYADAEFNIQEVREIGRRRALELHCVGAG